MGWPMGLQVAASQSLAVLSRPPVRIRFPSGLKATDQTKPFWGKGRPTGWAVALSRTVTCRPPSGQGELAIGTERDAPDDSPMLHRLADELAGAGVQEPAPRIPARSRPRQRTRPRMGIWQPVRIVPPSGLRATAMTSPGYADHLAERPPRGRVPQPVRSCPSFRRGWSCRHG